MSLNANLPDPIAAPTIYEDGVTVYAGRDIERIHGLANAQGPFALALAGLGVRSGVGNGMLASPGTGLSVNVSSGAAVVGGVGEGLACGIQLAQPFNRTGVPASRSSSNPVYLFAKFDPGDYTPSGGGIVRPDSFETRQGLYVFGDSPTVAGWVNLATITTSVSAILTCVPNPARFIQVGSGSVSASANTFLAGPVSGAAATSTYRLIQALDIPPLNQLQAPVGDLSIGGYKLTGVATPVNDTDAANKAYVDAARAGLRVKDAVRAATTANITLSGTQTIDGVALVAGDRVLVKNQTTGSQNGIYVVAAGAWSRSSDADTSAEVKGGLTTWVNEGTTNADTQYTLVTNDPIVLGTTSLTFAVFSVSGGVSSVNGNTGTVTVDDSNINGQDPTNGSATVTLRTIFTNLFSAIGNRAPKGLLTASGLTIGTGKLAGRTTAVTGAVEEIAIGTGLSLSGGTLSATGGSSGGGNTAPILQTGHGFAVGNLVRSSGTAGQFVKAQADSDANSQVVGAVTAVADANNFTLGLAGATVTLSGLTTGEGYYLDPTTAGAYTVTKPTAAGQVQRFVLRAISTTQAIYEARSGILVVVGNAPKIVTVTATASIATDTDVHEVNAGATATTQTLPSAYAGKLGRITIKQLGTGTITVAAGSGTTLEAGSITTQGTSLDYYLSGTVWRKI